MRNLFKAFLIIIVLLVFTKIINPSTYVGFVICLSLNFVSFVGTVLLIKHFMNNYDTLKLCYWLSTPEEFRNTPIHIGFVFWFELWKKDFYKKSIAVLIASILSTTLLLVTQEPVITFIGGFLSISALLSFISRTGHTLIMERFLSRYITTQMELKRILEEEKKETSEKTGSETSSGEQPMN